MTHVTQSGESDCRPLPVVDVVTLGETMVLFQPLQDGPLAYAPLLTRSVAGAESNLAIALSRLGKRVRWISRLGADPFGDMIAAILAGEGVDTSLVTRDPGAPTAIYFRQIKGYGDPDVYYYRRGSAASYLSPGEVQPAWFEGARHFHVTGITPALGPATEAAVVAAMKLAREMGLTISFDPNLRRKLWEEERARRTLLALVPRCDIFLPGLEEAEFLIGSQPTEAHGEAFLSLGPRIVVLKLGEHGSMAFAGDWSLRAACYPVSRLVDPIGAGDAFDAGFLSILLDEPEWQNALSPALLQKALERANLMGALATQYHGDWEGLPTLPELEQIQSGKKRVTR